MKIEWIITKDEISRVKAFIQEYQANAFVKRRIRRNLCKDKQPVSESQFWERHIGCLLTSQQRSGPNSPVFRFMKSKPFPLAHVICKKKRDVEAFSLAVLSDFGGLRFAKIISRELAANLTFLNEGGWEPTFRHLEAVRTRSTPEIERTAAEFLAEHLIGIGPKQSRNLLQWLGLSRYEVPIDSRITRWLNKFGFPFKLTSNALGDHNYYNLVSDGFQRLSLACGVKPCVLDATIFASYDGDGWTEENAGD